MMSITFRPSDNTRYCDNNDLVEQMTCFGETYPKYPFELNVSNANGRVILGALGIETEDLFGNVDPHYLLKRLADLPPSLMLQRETIEYQGARGACVIDFGVTAQQLERYWLALTEIALEAERREVPVTFD